MAGIEYGEELAMLAESASEFARAHSGFEVVRERISTDAGFETTLFREMAGLGWTGVMVPEAYGGSELGATAMVTLLEPLGRALYGSPLLATTLAGQLLCGAGSNAQKERWLPKLVSGEWIGTVALTDESGSWEIARPSLKAERRDEGFVLRGAKLLVLDAAAADLIVVSAVLDGAAALFAIERSALSAKALRREVIIDEVRRAYRVDFEDVYVAEEARLQVGDAGSVLSRIALLGALLVASEMCGGTAGVMGLTLEYLRTRKQFGRSIGSYQALKHPMAEILIDYELGRSLLYHAATAVDRCETDREVAVRMAKAHCGESFMHATDRSIQFHGGFGFTYECQAQLFFRRAMWAEHSFGDAAHHRRHLQSLLLDADSSLGRPMTA